MKMIGCTLLASSLATAIAPLAAGQALPPCSDVGPASVLENEPCGSDTNGGCNMAVPAFTNIAVGDVVLGNYWAAGGTRDTDWYEFTTSTDRTVKWEVYAPAGVGAVVFLLDANCPPAVIAGGASTGCPACASAFLPAGTWRAFVATPSFDGLPCDGGDYYAVLSSDAGDCPPPVVCGESNPQDCCAGGGLPGCSDQACCEAVCAVDSFCCDTAWDTICVSEAFQLCGSLCAAACSGSANDCCFASPDGTPGCSDEACCLAVCAADPFCCNTQWDGVCAGEAFGICAPLCGEICGTNNPNDCCLPGSGAPGCNDVDCCNAVCAIDPFCCDSAWDTICAGEACQVCPACAVTVPEEVPACTTLDRNVSEDEPCGQDTNGGCNNPSGLVNYINIGDTVTGNTWAACNFRDTDWYEFTVTGGPITVTWSVYGPVGFPMAAFILDVNCPPTVLAIGAGDCPVTASFCLADGTYRVFAAPTVFDGLPCAGGQYFASLTTDGLPCEPPVICGEGNPNDCCQAGGGTPGCSDAACCEQVCAIDAFCCQVQWDSICASEAASLCGICGGGCPSSANDCCTASPDFTPGCSDADCCNAVCAIDTFCCTTQWDSLCASEAASLCGTLCGGGLPNDDCAGRLPIGDGSTPFSTIGSTTSLPPLDPACEEGFGLAFVNDIWFTYTATCTGTATFTICNAADYDTRMALYASCEDTVPLACNDDAISGLCGLTSEMPDVPVVAGTQYLLRIGGFGGSGTGTVTISCTASCTPGPDRNGDGCVNGADLGLVIGNWGVDGGFGPGDANCDGIVNGADIGIVIGGWSIPPC